MRVICTLPNNITEPEIMSGVIYVPIELRKNVLVRVSDDMPEEEAKRLLTISGYDVYHGDEALTKQVDGAISKFKSDYRQSLMSNASEKDRTILELQENLRLTQQELDDVRARNVELETENAEFRKDLGEPSMQWTRKKLEEKANEFGIPVTTGMTKEDILKEIELHIAKRG